MENVHKNAKDGIKVLNRNMMKYLAIFFMFWGHLFSWVLLYRNPDVQDPYTLMPLWMRIVTHGSLFCPPVMFFFIADGYKYTRDRKKYALRLLIFACITQPFDWLLFPAEIRLAFLQRHVHAAVRASGCNGVGEQP